MKLWPFKRESETQEDRTFVPLGSGGASYGAVFSPPLARCLALYTDFLVNCPLEAENEDDPLFKLLTRRPCPFMSRANFYRLCVERYFVFDGFFAIIKTNDRGEIKALLPYASPQAVQVYPTNFKKQKNDDPVGDWGDPEKLYTDNFYFRDYRAEHIPLIKCFIFAPQHLTQQQVCLNKRTLARECLTILLKGPLSLKLL